MLSQMKSKRIRRPLALATASALLLIACGSDGSDVGENTDSAVEANVPELAPDGGEDGGDPVPPNGQTIEVAALDNTFRPESVEIVAGTEVQWENRGRNEHNMTPSDDVEDWGVPTEDFIPGDEYSRVFDTPGTYAYYCSLHGTPDAGMIGEIVVLPADGDAPAESDDPTGTDAPTGDDESELTADGVLDVPEEFASITEAVDASQPGDLVLIAPGVYNEAVDVTTDEVTIRGLDRNEVILDGEFELENGVRILGANGVAVENLTVQNYTNDGVFWTSVDGYRGSYLTTYRTGGYGIYAFDSVNGLLEHSYASGSSDGGFYIGQCYPCNAVVDDVIAEYNGFGYSGTTAGGNLFIINSRFNNNRSGMQMNSATYELCYPQRENTIVGNLVYSNNQVDTPSIDAAILAAHNGILVEGGVGNVIERNRVYDHDKTGIGLVVFPEFTPNDAEPDRDQWSKPCSDTRDLPLADPSSLNAIFWSSYNNRVIGNVVEDSREGDLAITDVDASDLSYLDPVPLGNCFSDNTFVTSAPTDIEELLPCDGEGSGGDWTIGALDAVRWITDVETEPPSVDYDIAPTPEPPLLEGMADASTAPANPATNVPPTVDIASITVPDRP
jgi:plastocyanin